VIHLDTCALIESLTGPRRAEMTLRRFIREGHRLGVCTIVLYEWWRGPRTPEELDVQERLLPRAAAFDFGVREAQIAAQMYGALRRPRGREIDIAIAACAIAQDAPLWTLNPADFSDLPGLKLADDPG
jgi:predicted nucleic acid-binding protein